MSKNREAIERLENFKQNIEFIINRENWYAQFPHTYELMAEMKILLRRCMWEDHTINNYQYIEYCKCLDNTKKEMITAQYEWVQGRLKNRSLTIEQIISSVFDVVFGYMVEA